ncbi:hypothetical protein [Streptomyces werraensis]|uniref:hypothetical protein n=1 Tax=Streptomyces werraensis TaxID=68284 RepID=UPI001CE3A174
MADQFVDGLVGVHHDALARRDAQQGQQSGGEEPAGRLEAGLQHHPQRVEHDLAAHAGVRRLRHVPGEPVRQASTT